MIVLDWGLTTIQEHKDVSKFCDTFSIECLFYKKMLNLLQISLKKKLTICYDNKCNWFHLNNIINIHWIIFYKKVMKH